MLLKLLCLAFALWGLYTMWPYAINESLRACATAEGRRNVHMHFMGDAIRGIGLMLFAAVVFLIFR
jgi:hypothetical protein